MSIAPGAALVRLFGAWTAGAALLVVWPELEGVAIAALLVLASVAFWDFLELVRRPALDATRTLPDRTLVGRAAELVVDVVNRSRRPIETDVIDELPASVTTSEPTHRAVRVEAGGTLTLREPIRPTERGDVSLGPIVLLERSPYRLWWRRRIAATSDALRVYPDASRYLHADALRPRRVLAELGLRPIRERGAGMEFESLRDYVVGDDVRRIDWAASARRGRPITRLYQHERNRTVVIALDASRLMASVIDGRTKLDHAVDAALALAYGALTAGDRVGMLAFDATIRGSLAPAPRRTLGPFVELLRAVQPRLVEADYVGLARQLVGGRQRRSLVIVLGDFVDADTAALVEPLAVLARHHRVLFTAIRDRVYAGLEPRPDDDALSLYRRLALDELLVDRDTALNRLRRAGLETLDLVPERLTAGVLNRYLAMRRAAA